MCVPVTGLPVSQGLQIGELYTVAGLTAYVVPPRDPATYDGRALLLLPDMTGIGNVNNRILAEQFASEGNFYTVMPELQGAYKAAPESVLARYEELAALEARSERGRLESGLAQVRASMLRSQLAQVRWQHELGCRSQQAVDQVKTLVQELRRSGVTKVACVGVGSGAELLTPLAVTGAVDAWAVVHGRASRKLASKAKTPGIIQAAAHDPFLPEAELEVVQRTVDVRQATAEGPVPDIQIRQYPGTYHGFAVRGAAKSTLVMAAKIQVMRTTVEFLAGSLASQPDPRYQCALVGRHSMTKPAVSITASHDAHKVTVA